MSTIQPGSSISFKGPTFSESKKISKQSEFPERVSKTASKIKDISFKPLLLTPRKDGTSPFTDVVDTASNIGPLVIFPLIAASLTTVATFTLFTLPFLLVAGTVKLFALAAPLFTNKNNDPIQPYFPIGESSNERETVKLLVRVVSHKATPKERKSVEQFFNKERLDKNKANGWISDDFYNLMTEFTNTYEAGAKEAASILQTSSPELQRVLNDLIVNHKSLTKNFKSSKDRVTKDNLNKQIKHISDEITAIKLKLSEFEKTKIDKIENSFLAKIRPLLKDYLHHQRKYYDAEIQRKIEKKFTKKMKIGNNEALDKEIVSDKKIKLKQKIEGPVKRTSQKASLLNEAIHRREAARQPYNEPLPLRSCTDKKWKERANELLSHEVKNQDDITNRNYALVKLGHLEALLRSHQDTLHLEVIKEPNGETSYLRNLLNEDRLKYNFNNNLITEEFYAFMIEFKNKYDSRLEEIRSPSNKDKTNELIAQLNQYLTPKLEWLIQNYPVQVPQNETLRFIERESMRFIRENK